MNDRKIETKKWIWVPCAKELFKPAYILEETDKHVIAQSNIKETFKHLEIYKMNPQKFEKVDDLAFLSHLNEPSVLYNLKKRYDDSLIYTYSGLFLIALNPYKTIFINAGDEHNGKSRNTIYADCVKQEIMNGKKKEDMPHIFSIANEAYRNMLSNGENQSILITGESGAGKTENTKRVIEFLAFNNDTSIDRLLLSANPILEAFGNAKTIKNDNSSRFGKFIQLKFKGGIICGARIEKYLLEKSRVVFQNTNERSYHIFYYLIRGADSSLRESLSISDNPADYACIRNSCYSIKDVDDRAEFMRLNECFDKLGITDTLKYYKIISAILHLGNVEFDTVPVTENHQGFNDAGNLEKIRIKNTKEIEIACNLLGIPMNEFIKQILHPSIKAGNEIVTHYRTCDESMKIVQGLMKLLYVSIFDILIFDINSILDKSSSDSFIGVLDIAGFEIFEKNSFEQLCINYTNEKLQQFFNHHMFILEQEIYKNECIDWDFIDFGLDLEPTISTIESNNPIGILSYLDEECVMPCASDATLLNKINQVKGIEKNPFNSSFKLKHYAGYVEYEVFGWLEKNKDIHSETLHSLIGMSLIDNFKGSIVYNNMSNEGLKKGIFRTVSQSHRENLKRLMDLLSRTQPHFVRCILPNLSKNSNDFNKQLVLNQLRCNGVLEGIRISRLGYPSRMGFEEFNKRYSIFLEDEDKVSELCQDLSEDLIPRNLTIKILAIINAVHRNETNNDCKVGKTLIFFKQGVLADFEELRDKKITLYAISIQTLFRRRIALRKFNLESERNSAISLILANSQRSISFLRWKWWNLFLKIKPLLEVKKNESQIKEKDDKINEYISVIEKHKNEKVGYEKQISDISTLLQDLERNNETLKLNISEKNDLLSSLRNANLSSKKHMQSMLENAASKEKSLCVEMSLLSDNLSNDLCRICKFEKDLINKTKTMEAEISSLKTHLEEKSRSAQLLYNQIDELHEIQRRKEDEYIERISKTDLNLNTLLKEKEQELAKVKEMCNSLQKGNADLKEIEKSLQSLKNKHDIVVSEFQMHVNESNEKIFKLEQENKSEINEKNKSYDLLKSDFAVLKESYETKDQDSKRIASKLSSVENYNKKLKEDLENAQFVNESLQNDVRKKSNVESELNKLILTLKQDIEYQKSKNASLENNNAMLKTANDDLRSELNSHVYSSAESVSNPAASLGSLSSSSLATASALNKEEIKNLKAKLHDYKEKLSNEESLNKILMKDKEELYNENLRLMQSRLEDLFKGETEFNQIKKGLQGEILRLERENEALSKEINEMKTSNSSDSNLEDFAFERINKLFENEKAVRKQLDLNLIELENKNARNENTIRELTQKIKDQEELESNLSKVSANNSLKELEIKKIKEDLEYLSNFISQAEDTFQKDYFSLVKSKDKIIAEKAAEVASLLDKNKDLELSISKLKDFEDQNAIIKNEIDSILKTNSLMKNELDSMAVTNGANMLLIGELRDHISKLETMYNQREDEVSKEYLRVNKKIEELDKIKTELSKKSEVLSSLIDSSFKDDKFNIRCISSLEDLVNKRYSKKMDEMNKEITELRHCLDLKEVECIKMKDLLESITIAKEMSENNGDASGDGGCLKYEIVEKHNLVSSFVVDKESFKASQRKSLISCNCKFMEKLKIVEVPKENKDDVIKLENELNLLNLKLSQSERALREQVELTEAMKGFMSISKRRK